MDAEQIPSPSNPKASDVDVSCSELTGKPDLLSTPMSVSSTGGVSNGPWLGSVSTVTEPSGSMMKRTPQLVSLPTAGHSSKGGVTEAPPVPATAAPACQQASQRTARVGRRDGEWPPYTGPVSFRKVSLELRGTNPAHPPFKKKTASRYC